MSNSTDSAQKLNPIAQALNEKLETAAPEILEMLSAYGRRLYFPKGIISQTAEAKQKATRFNATIGIAVSLVLSEKGAYMADGKQLRAFRLSDGKPLWSVPATFNNHKDPDVFLTGGLVWAAGYNANKRQLAPDVKLTYMGVNGYDPETGKLVKQIPQQMIRPMGHDRCYRNRITDSAFMLIQST